jgi:putative ABC transport system permease protein
MLPTAPPEVDGLGDVRGFPMLAAGALVLLGVLATAHALIVTVRRRRQELGVLSALGFTPSMRRTVIVAQATTVACVALAIGIPLGAFLGRTVWSTIAEAMGVAGDPVTPLALLAAGAAGLVLALNAIAAVPGQAAYRLRAGEALRAE